MRDKKLITKKPAGSRARNCGEQEINERYSVECNQFFVTYSDGSREVRNIAIDYDDYRDILYGKIKQNIAKNIARLRKEKRISREYIAERVGLSRQYIFQIENGERNVTLESLSKIASVLKVNIEFLISEAPFRPSNIYINKLIAEIRELEPQRQKELCATIIEKLWSENS